MGCTLNNILAVIELGLPFWIQDPEDETHVERFENLIEASLEDYRGFNLNGEISYLTTNGEGELVLEMKWEEA